jgi:hypothetical protein
MVAVVLVVLTATGTARAERVRFHYPAADINGSVVHAPTGPNVVGERIAWFGAVREPARCRMCPTHLVTFHHPYSGANVTVPMRLSEDLPNIQHRGDRIIYNYGSYSVEIVFTIDGSVDVVYNSGPGRPLSWCHP